MRTQTAQTAAVTPPSQWKKFGEWLRAVRQERGISGRELARRAAISYSTLRMLEDGGRRVYDQWRDPNPEGYTLHRIAEGLGVDPSEVFTAAGRNLSGSTAVPTGTTDIEGRLMEAMAALGEALGQIRQQQRERPPLQS